MRAKMHGRQSVALIATAAMILAILALVPAAPARAQGGPVTLLVSVGTSGQSGEDRSDRPHISGNGNVVAFDSSARDIVPGDFNGVKDAFVRDMTTGVTERVSVSTAGVQANEYSTLVSINGDGRYVVFQSIATNLDPIDTLGNGDIYLRDRVAGTTRVISVNRFGGQSNGNHTRPSICADGSKVAWNSSATNLITGDTNGLNDIYVRDLTTNTTSRITPPGAEPNGVSVRPEMSDDCTKVIFESYASNWVPNDTNNRRDVFLHDLTTGQTQRASVDTNGNDIDGEASRPHLSADGRYVTFQTKADDVVPNDTNLNTDVFRRDMLTGTNVLISQSAGGVQGASESTRGVLSADGRHVVFNSYSANLVPADTNGQQDIFLRDVDAGTTTLVSLRLDGLRGSNGNSYRPELSDDATKVAYRSAGSNLTTDDTNGTWDIFWTDLTGTGGGGGGGGGGADAEAPVATIASPTANQVLASLAASGSATDDKAVATAAVVVKDRVSRLYLQGNGSFGTARALLPAVLDAPGATSSGWTFAASVPDGSYALELIVRDTAGKRAPKPIVTFTVAAGGGGGGGGGGADAEAPVATIASPTANQVLASLAASGSATDDKAVATAAVVVKDRVSKLYLQGNGSFGTARALLPAVLDAPGATSSGWTFAAAVPDGSYALELIVRDTAGKRAPKPTVVFTVSAAAPPPGGLGGDTEVPVATIATPGAWSTIPTLQASGSATDDTGVASAAVVVKDRVSKLYLQPDGSWATARALLPAVLDAPGATSSGWTFAAPVPDGAYALELIVRDTAGKRADKPNVRFAVG